MAQAFEPKRPPPSPALFPPLFGLQHKPRNAGNTPKKAQEGPLCPVAQARVGSRDRDISRWAVAPARAVTGASEGHATTPGA